MWEEFTSVVLNRCVIWNWNVADYRRWSATLTPLQLIQSHICISVLVFCELQYFFGDLVITWMSYYFFRLQVLHYIFMTCTHVQYVMSEVLFKRHFVLVNGSLSLNFRRIVFIAFGNEAVHISLSVTAQRKQCWFNFYIPDQKVRICPVLWHSCVQYMFTLKCINVQDCVHNVLAAWDIYFIDVWNMMWQ